MKKSAQKLHSKIVKKLGFFRLLCILVSFTVVCFSRPSAPKLHNLSLHEKFLILAKNFVLKTLLHILHELWGNPDNLRKLISNYCTVWENFWCSVMLYLSNNFGFKNDVALNKWQNVMQHVSKLTIFHHFPSLSDG